LAAVAAEAGVLVVADLEEAASAAEVLAASVAVAVAVAAPAEDGKIKN
jgi:hypothetical protein